MSRARAVAFALAIAALGNVFASSTTSIPEWVVVEYGEIVDRREPTHSGEPVGVLLDRLQGRPIPNDGDRPDDLLAHTLLDAPMERYAFVLPDALDALNGPAERPFAEFAWRWTEGEPQPAWVELVRARRYVVETDGAGAVRVYAPVDGAQERSAAAAARLAWERGRPVLRHVLDSIRRAEAAGAELQVDVYPWYHRPERTTFLLGTRPHRVEPSREPAPSARPRVDLDDWTTFLDSGWTLEGARIEPGGVVRLIGAERDPAPTVSGRPLSLADLAVAYRAVVHGGRAEPYMSLDRGFGPETSVVNYGGRLRDTRLGEVALRCDIRFKTFSLGLDVTTGEDVRSRVRSKIPEFRSHLERFADDPGASGILSQQTRLWFYPDDVDLTLSPQGDVLVLRRVRMSAASERLAEGGIDAARGEDPPWTRATVEAINRHYDRLAALFPELRELDQVVRLLALFTWLQRVDREGLAVPALDGLLAVELPALYTPRRFPRLLAFNALPPAGAEGAVATISRPDVYAWLTRLRPRDGGALRADLRFRRAVDRLDADDPAHRRMLDEVGTYDATALSDAELDFLAYRAERLAMHRMVMDTLSPVLARPLAERARTGERLRVFSVAIGGLDLGMGRAIASASRRSIGLVGSAGGRPASIAVDDRGPDRADPRTRTAIEPVTSIEPAVAIPRRDPVRIEQSSDPASGRSIRVVTDPAGPGARLREVHVPTGDGAFRVTRYEGGRTFVYRLERDGTRLSARESRRQDRAATVAPMPAAGFTWIRIAEPSEPDDSAGVSDIESGAVDLIVTSADGTERRVGVPRERLRRLVLGARAHPQRPAVHADDIVPEVVTAGTVWLVRPTATETRRPWRRVGEIPAPEETAARIVDGLRRAASEAGERPRAAVGVRVDAPDRLQRAPSARKKPLLLIPDAAFESEHRDLRGRIASAWAPARVAGDASRVRPGGVLVLVSDEPPDLLAERALQWAADERMNDRLLLVVAAGVPVRSDLPARLLEAGSLAGVSVMSFEPTELHELAERLGAFARALGSAERDRSIVEIDSGSVWYF